MAKARRAKTRPSRVLIPVAVVVLLLIGGVVAGQEGLFNGRSATTTSPTVLGTEQTADPSSTPSAVASASPTDEATATPSSTDPTSTTETASSTMSSDLAAQDTLKSCQETVRAATRVIDAAQVGVGHWSEHVQAQTDANAGKISVETMDGIFKRTRLAGPDDVKAYEDALKSYKELTTANKNACDAPAGASAEVATKLSRCNERSSAQEPVLQAAKDGMDDWESHLAAMRRSRMGHVDDAEGVWIRAWQAAPPHIKTFDEAVKDFDAPSC